MNRISALKINNGDKTNFKDKNWAIYAKEKRLNKVIENRKKKREEIFVKLRIEKEQEEERKQQEEERKQKEEKEKTIGRGYIDETMLWQRQCRFSKEHPVIPSKFSNSQLTAMKIGERSEALFEMYFLDICNKIFENKKVDLYFSTNVHAPFCDALIRVDNETNRRLVEIKTSYEEGVVPMNKKAYYAMKQKCTPDNGIIVSVLYDQYRNFTGRFYICSMRQVPSLISDTHDGRYVCKLQYEHIVDVF